MSDCRGGEDGSRYTFTVCLAAPLGRGPPPYTPLLCLVAVASPRLADVGCPLAPPTGDGPLVAIVLDAAWPRSTLSLVNRLLLLLLLLGRLVKPVLLRTGAEFPLVSRDDRKLLFPPRKPPSGLLSR